MIVNLRMTLVLLSENVCANILCLGIVICICQSLTLLNSETTSNFEFFKVAISKSVVEGMGKTGPDKMKNCRFILEILNMGPISSRKHEMEIW